MNHEVLSVIQNLETSLSGRPWYGKAVYELLQEIDESKTTFKPNHQDHSLNDLLWHMITWAEFVLAHLENQEEAERKAIEARDWRITDPFHHSWQKGITKLKSIHKKIADLLADKEDSFLNEMVPNRPYNFRFMLNGLIQHNIYHAGQMAYLKKMLN